MRSIWFSRSSFACTCSWHIGALYSDVSTLLRIIGTLIPITSTLIDSFRASASRAHPRGTALPCCERSIGLRYQRIVQSGGEPKSRRRCGRGEPSPGADVVRGRAQSRRRCGPRASRVPGALRALSNAAYSAWAATAYGGEEHARAHQLADRHGEVRIGLRRTDWNVQPSPGEDVAAPVQMWQQSRRRCGRGEPSPGADVAEVSRVPVQMWQL